MRVRALGMAAAFVGAAVAGSCLVDDPNHCANKEGGGDAFCAKRDDGLRFCSTCVKSTENSGCVEEQPDADCRVSGDDIAGTSGATTGGGPTGTGGGSMTAGDDDVASTGSPDCTAEGGVDEACPAEAPYCIDGTCSACDEGGDGFCAGVDAGTPFCGAAGVCAECDPADAGSCGGGEFCSAAGVCGGCTSHEQCAPDGCMANECQACDLSSGKCFEGSAFWVDQDNCSGADPGGEQNDPYCDLATAISNAANGISVFTVWVRPSSMPYPGPVSLNASNTHKVAVIGESGRPQINGTAQAANVSVSSNRLFMSNLDLVGGSDSTARCANARLWLDDVTVRNGPVGVRGESCALLWVRDSVITGADENGLLATGSDLTMLSSAVVNNGDETDGSFGGISLSSTTWSIVYSTVAANLRSPSVAGGGLECDASSPGDARNSIFQSGNRGDAIDCATGMFHYNVTDVPGLAGEGNVMEVYQPVLFDNPGASDFHIRPPLDTSPFRDVGRWQAGDPETDVDGDLHPLVDGAPDWVGFDVPAG